MKKFLVFLSSFVIASGVGAATQLDIIVLDESIPQLMVPQVGVNSYRAPVTLDAGLGADSVTNGAFTDGADFAVNGAFTTDVSWTVQGTGWDVNVTTATKAHSDGTQSADSDLVNDGVVVIVAGQVYTTTYTVAGFTAGNVVVVVGAQEATDRGSNATFTELVTASDATALTLRADLDFVGDVDDISVALVGDAGWTQGTGWLISGGNASSDGSQSADADLENIGNAPVAGSKYEVVYTVSNYSAGNVTAVLGTQEATDRSSNATFTETIVATDTTILKIRADLDFIGDIDDVTMKLITDEIAFEIASITNKAGSDGNDTLLKLTHTDTLSPGTSKLLDADGVASIDLTGAITSDALTASEILITDASKVISSAAVATYPSLAELIHVKGVTSAIQTQIDASSGTVTSSGSPLNNEVATFTTGTDIDSDSTFTWDATTLTVLGTTIDAGGVDVATGDTYAVNSVDVITGSALGSGVLASSLTSVGVLADPQITQIQLGNAADTTIARVSAGVVSIEGTNIAMSGGAFHDGFSDFVTNEHLDWTSSVGTIHIGNYIENATHTGQVTGSGALSLDITAVTDQPASGAIAAADTVITNDGGVLSEATFTQQITFFDANLGFGNGTVTSSGSPLVNEVAVFTTGTDIDSDSTFTWDGTTLITNALTANGAFTSPGIDDNATTERLQLADTILTLGPSSTAEYAITRVLNTGRLRIAGGDAGNDGTNIRFFGSADATQPNDFQVFANSSLELFYDDSNSDWDAQENNFISLTFESDVTTGTAPFTIASTTVSANLNADQVDGNEATALLARANHTGTQAETTITGLRWSKSITVEDPTASEDINIGFFNVAVTITEIRCVTRGSTPSVTVTFRHGTDRSATGAEAVTGGTVVTSVSTGSDITAFNDATIVADSFIWLETTAESGTTDEVSCQIIGTED